MRPEVTSFFDPATYTVSHILADPESKQCAIIDSVLDYDPKSGRTSTDSVAAIERCVRQRGYSVAWILETHAHADHLSGAQYLKQCFNAPIGIGAHIRDVQGIFKGVFNLEKEFATDGSQFDRLLEDDEMLHIGALELRVMHTPGHTPACLTFVCGKTAFVGDTLFMPDYGTARTDFPGGDAATLYRSIQKVLSLPADTILYMCHDYLPNSGVRSEYQWQTTVADQRVHNVHVHEGVSEQEFVAMRTKRDSGLDMPVLILPSVQVNIRAGSMPPAESNGISYLKIPLDAL